MENVYELPDNITDEHATFLDPMTAAIHAVDVAAPRLLDKVVILGAGPIGLIIAQVVRAMGAADVFLTDLPVAHLAELGCDYAALSAAKPDLVYARGSGFGPRGPDRDLPALDELAAARTGMMPILPQP